jgi:hypothetical protein
MDILIRCPSCQSALRLPAEAAGHRARCFKCNAEFNVPTVQQLMEDTVYNWIEQDVEEVLENRERLKDQQLAPQAEETSSRQSGVFKTVSAEEGSRPRTPPAPPPAPKTHAKPASPPKPHRESSHHRWPMKRAEAEPIAPPEHESKIAFPRVMVSPDDSALAAPAVYPTNLHVEGRIPHLVVNKVDTGGVRFAFDSAWLAHDGFRASMPMRCVFSGSADRTRLIARPLLFLDRSLAGKLSLEQVNSQHEIRTLGDRSPREIMQAMAMIEAMPRPFLFPMPYYVSTKYAHRSLHSRTVDRVSGAITCQVLIPDAVCGLDWLSHVNGVCGPEYHLLLRDVSMLHGDAWRELSDECRQRINVWCKLGPHEIFRRYFNDADFGRRDEGLAGLVLTDHRMVFCKYHHRGQLPLDADDASLLIRCDPRFASVTLIVGSQRSRVIKLHRHDVEPLVKELANSEKISVVVEEVSQAT